MEDLIYEDREIVLQILREAMVGLTDQQTRCLFLCWLGFTQKEVSGLLGISQPVVNQHFNTALSNIEDIAQEYL